MPRFFTEAREGHQGLMKAIVYRHHGEEDVLEATAVPPPKESTHHLIVRVTHSSINPVDVKLRRHPVLTWMRPLPKIPGTDVVGIVVHAPDDSGFAPGDRICAMMPLNASKWGSAAELAPVPVKLAVKVPDDVDDAQAACIPLVGLTVVQSFRKPLHDWGGKADDKKILVQGASGGLGSVAVQYCKHVLGAHVAATCSEKNFDFVKGLGADEVIDYKNDKFEEKVRDFDAVFDIFGYEYEHRTLSSHVLKPHGHYIHIASSDIHIKPGDPEADWLHMGIPEAKPANLMKLFLRYLKPKLFGGVHYHPIFVVPDGTMLQALVQWLSEKKIRLPIDRSFSIDDLQDAHRYLAQGHTHGKILINHKAWMPEDSQE